ALESIAYQICDVLRMMHADSGVPLQRIKADGGATANAFLMQFIADIVQIEILAGEVAESSPLGAVWCGALGQRAIASQDELRTLAADATAYAPTMDSAQAESYYNGWQRAVERVL